MRLPPRSTTGAYEVAAEAAVADALTAVSLLPRGAERAAAHAEVLSLGTGCLAVLREHGPPPSAGLYRLLMRAAGTAGDGPLALSLLAQLHDAGLAADARAANALLSSLADESSAFEAYRRLQGGGAALDTSSFNTMLRRAASAPVAERASLVQRLLRDLRLRSLAPDQETLAAAVSALGSAGAADEAYALWQDFRAGGLKPCARGWAALLSALRDGGQYSRVEALFATLRGHGGAEQLDTVHYNIVADALVRARQPSRALALSTLLAQDGLRADQVTRNTMLLAVAELSGVDAAFAYAAAGRRDAITWTTLTSLAADARDPKRAAEAVVDMRLAGFSPDVVTYTALIKAHGADAVSAVAVYRVMVAEGVVANASTFLTLLRSCQAAGDAALASEMYVEMRRAGLRPSSAHFRSMLALASDEGAAVPALPGWLLQTAGCSLENGHMLIDLHAFSAPEARAAVLYTLRMLKEETQGRLRAVSAGLVIVTGRSSGRASVLQAEVCRLCAELRLPCEVHPRNSGRLLVDTSRMMVPTGRST